MEKGVVELEAGGQTKEIIVEPRGRRKKGHTISWVYDTRGPSLEASLGFQNSLLRQNQMTQLG